MDRYGGYFFTVESSISRVFFSTFFLLLSFAVLEFESGVILNYIAVEFMVLTAELLVHTFSVLVPALYFIKQLK